MPGGSSSGPVAAAAAGLVDFALGTHRGLVRLPASFCGVLGIRTSHGAIDLDLAMPLAPASIPPGFARDGAIFARVGAAYGMVAVLPAHPRLLWASDAFARADAGTGAALGGLVDAAQARFGAAREITLSTDLSAWRECFRIHQAGEIWRVHGDWVTAANRLRPRRQGTPRQVAGITDAARGGRRQPFRDHHPSGRCAG